MTPAIRHRSASAPLACLVLAAAVAAVPVVATASDGAPADEPHLADVTQLTFGGENAEAYWSPDGERLIFQSQRPPYECDQIFVIEVPELGGDEPVPEPELVSTGQGRTTCAYFSWPDGERILYSSTHLADAACPPAPDRSKGYVWPLYRGYEIFETAFDGSYGAEELVKLTAQDGYDAEATACPVDGSIVFTSDRDGDLELYRMDADGSNVKRLTNAPGYDGGAFFSADCSKIVWRASRPADDEELADFQGLLAQGLVRPGQLEIWVAAADGSDPRQVTYLGAASFAPFFFPSGDRIIFSSNYGNDNPREFDLWAIDVQGTRLERITRSEGFDGFPMFSPDGTRLAFASNRDQGAPGETNVFVARWVDPPPPENASEPRSEKTAADRYLADVAWLADDRREGRGIQTDGLEMAAGWLGERFREIGLEPAAGEDGYRQSFEVPVAVSVEEGTAVSLNGEPLAEDAFQPLAFSSSGEAAAEVVPAGYGVTASDRGIDDYHGVDVRGKIALVRRFLPAGGLEEESLRRRYSDLRYKAYNAREHGAVGLIVVDLPEPDAEEAHGGMPAEGEPDEARFPSLSADSGGTAGIPAVIVEREAARALFEGGGRAEIAVELARETRPAVNVVGRLPAGAAEKRPGAVVIGAHYDHLGMGGDGSLAPGKLQIHNGADDNASGVAALLEAARVLSERRGELARDVWFVAFSGEETGLLGSNHLTKEPPPGLDLDAAVAMINMDMVGRLRGNTLSVLGGESAEEWSEVVEPACAGLGLGCTLGGDGYGPSDHTSFYAAGVPVLHLFSGVHDDYHKPSDDTPTINAAGGARVAHLAADLAARLAARTEPLTYKRTSAPPPSTGDARSFGASLGTVPDYAGPPEGTSGVLLSGVRPDSPAEKAGLARGDVLVELAGREIGDVYDFVYILRESKPGQTVTAIVVRDGERKSFEITFGESSR